jgi:hypothetical protein
MSTNRTIRRQALAAAGVLSLLAACSGGGSQATQDKPGEPTASATTQLGARAALTGFACQADDKGSWSATGTVNNADAAKATFVVRISVAGKNSHVVASTTKNVTVDASGEAKLDVADFGKATGKGLDCSAHVTRAVS